MKLTQAQVYTLLRLRAGTRYLVSGDQRFGVEVRYEVGGPNRDDVKSRSIVPLLKKGCVEFKSKPKDPDLHYEVTITRKGITALTEVSNDN
ncbi:hypothetical protein [Pantoea ananatis]|uniref:hypothetical protein n=1 Tax=Pantoea ananas TaxID=553 RepID=UPI0015759A4B|nr:hypothetical protein [Pantoea ananatis]NQE78588.1 hypothetical protein [Pantoea ananatis]NQE82491.1 hypothetical protein [Pantoea ananatis]